MHRSNDRYFITDGIIKGPIGPKPGACNPIFVSKSNELCCNIALNPKASGPAVLYSSTDHTMTQKNAINFSLLGAMGRARLAQA